jgi:alpha-beta hydrolase superfamily lysophospholipase
VNQSTVYDIAGDFLVSLEMKRRSEPSRPLLFVAHSLGGIIVKQVLRRSRDTYQNHLRDIYESTSGILFFGTPHGGADPRGLVQNIAEKCIRVMGFSVNEQIVNTLLPSAERLRELRDEFSPMVREKNWVIYSFQEQFGIKILNNNKVQDSVFHSHS